MDGYDPYVYLYVATYLQNTALSPYHVTSVLLCSDSIFGTLETTVLLLHVCSSHITLFSILGRVDIHIIKQAANLYEY